MLKLRSPRAYTFSIESYLLERDARPGTRYRQRREQDLERPANADEGTTVSTHARTHHFFF